MPDKSASADGARPRRTAPRWVLETWLWLTVAAAYFDPSVCRIEWDACRTFTSPILWLLLDLFPGSSMIVFYASLGAGAGVAALATVGVAGGCHLLLRRVIARRVSLPVFTTIYVAALGLGFVCDVIGMSLLASYSPLDFLRDLAGR